MSEINPDILQALSFRTEQLLNNGIASRNDLISFHNTLKLYCLIQLESIGLVTEEELKQSPFVKNMIKKSL